MTTDEAIQRVHQAARNAAWWRGEIKAGRADVGRDGEWLLLDLEEAGMVRRAREEG